METNIDKITKEILTGSQLELSNLVFNSDVMRIIEYRAHRKIRRKLFLSLVFVAAIIASSGYIVIRIFHIDLSSPPKGSGGFSGLIYSMLANIAGIISKNEYLILPLPGNSSVKRSWRLHCPLWLTCKYDMRK